MLLGFKKQFAAKIESGSKIHTFRNHRKVTPKIGETVYAYVGLRTKHTKKILGDYKYTGSQLVRLVIYRTGMGFEAKIHIGNKRTWTKDELDNMALNDGFETYYDFLEYWIGKADKIAFSGVCYHWTDFKY